MLVLSSFIPSKLTTNYLAHATPLLPVEGRKYTLTHSDITGQLFLAVGYEYNIRAINPKLRDEVIAEWVPQMGEFSLYGRVYVSGGEFDEMNAKARFLIFKKELNLAITAMVYGDKVFFMNYPCLLDAPIFIRFESIYTQFNQIQFYGTPRQFLNAATSTVTVS